jgi:hypothetical protein
MKFVVQPDFITQDEVGIIKSYEKPQIGEIQNYHIKSVNDAARGWTIMKDFSRTDASKEVTRFQGDGTLVEEVPVYFKDLGHRIARAVGVSDEHMFFQYIVIGPGGEIRKHYDAGKPGYITYKCNVCVEGPADDFIYVGDDVLSAKPLGLYCFEANLYKHWMDTSDVTRIVLSYGFLVPYDSLGWAEDSPRIRLSNRIWQAYIGRG